MTIFAAQNSEPLIVGLLIPLLGTMLGASFVFLMKDAMSARWRSR